MICDQLYNCQTYEALSPALKTAFDFLKSLDPNALEAKYEIDGSNIYAFSSSYETLPAAQRKIEAHRNYLDIQYIASGEEAIGYAPVQCLPVSEPYKTDVEFYDTKEDILIPAQAGTFMIFYPQDAHRPGCTWKKTAQVKKVVVKIAVDAL